jgi:hypothetical protein
MVKKPVYHQVLIKEKQAWEDNFKMALMEMR